MSERLARQQAERQGRMDRERTAAIAAREQGDQMQRAAWAQQKAVSDYWRELDVLAAGLSAMLTPPARDFTAERVAAGTYRPRRFAQRGKERHSKTEKGRLRPGHCHGRWVAICLNL